MVVSGNSKISILPALVCAGLCVVPMRTGFFMVFFLVPLGFCNMAFGAGTAWIGFIFAVISNLVLSVGSSLSYGAGLAGAGIEILYFTVFTLGFTWIMADNPSFIAPGIPRIRTVFRFVTASVAGALTFLGMIFTLGGEEGFSAIIRSQAEIISSAYIASSGADAAQRSFLERLFTPDRIIETFVMVIFRGGALFWAFFLFFFSRVSAFTLARLFRRKTGNSSGELIGFFVPHRTIWVLTFCLPAIIAFKAISLEIAEVTAWNLLSICVILFLAQGCGIVLFALARRPMSGIMRLFSGLLFVFLALSPGINILVMGALVLLGIAENWLPLRVNKQDMPAS